MSGPISITGAMPGDALGFTIDHIDIGDTVHVVMNARWRARGFSLLRSSVDHYRIEDNRAIISESLRIPIRPMVGCIATAPSRGVLSSLSPCRSTGGNLDLWQIGPGATVWLPVQIEGGLLALGDVHGSMGAGEPVGCGLECGGSVSGRVNLVKGFGLTGLRIETPDTILFAGSAHDSVAEAQNKATLAAWKWLTFECGLGAADALAVSAALLDLEHGGPAGANVVAGFSLQALRESGITPRLLSRDGPETTGH